MCLNNEWKYVYYIYSGNSQFLIIFSFIFIFLYWMRNNELFGSSIMYVKTLTVVYNLLLQLKMIMQFVNMYNFYI